MADKRLAVALALPLALGLVLAGCGGISITEEWVPEQEVREEPAAPPRYTAAMEGDRLVITATQDIAVIERPVERLTKHFEQTEVAFTWDEAGLVFFSVLGAIISGGLYALGYYLWDSTD
ncbi:MAG: hypothetical protein IT463_01335 [Planctomycetes bacterium]|nr:hypothetical protein [Planctomycetota bacterium]